LPVEMLASLALDAEAAAAQGCSSGRLALRRSWPRSTDHLLLEYIAPCGRLVPGQWFRDRDRCADVAARTGAGAVVVRSSAGPVLLQGNGADRRLTALAGVMAQPGAALLVHRPERRAVVRVPGTDGDRYVKVVRPGRAAGVVAPMAAVADRPGRPFALARALDIDDERGVIEWEALAGAPLHERLEHTAEPTLLADVGASLRWLHDEAGPVDAVHDADAEAAVVERWLALARAHCGNADAVMAAPAERVVSGLRGVPPGGTVTLHRDFHDKQVLVADDGVGLIDLDTLARGDAALDVANFLVHLELRVLQGLLHDAVAVGAAFLDGYGGTPGNVQVYADAARLRLACVYAYRPRWHAVAAAMAGRVGMPLDLSSS